MKCKVSVIMVTYNHEAYVEEAISGVLMQNTDFDFELIIANDCSPDNTDEIVTRFEKSHPNIIRYYKQSRNIGMMPNFIFALNKCQGKYIALCEGDDYWTDPFKLQKQVDFLENHLDYNICFHPVQRINEKGVLKDITNKNTKKSTNFEDLIPNNYIYTASSCVRRSSLPDELPTWFNHLPIGDYPLLLLAASTGKIWMLSEVMATYRLHEGGIWTSKGSVEIQYLWGIAIIEIATHFDPKFHDDFMKVAAVSFSKVLRYNLINRKRVNIGKSFRLYFQTSAYRPFINLLSPVKWWLQSFWQKQ